MTTEQHEIGITFYNPSRNRKIVFEDMIEESYGSKRIAIQTTNGLIELWFSLIWKIEVLSIEKLGNDGYSFFKYKIKICNGDRDTILTTWDSSYQSLLTACKNYKD